MPANVVKTPRQEELWGRAKEIVEDEYGLREEDGSRFYRLVMGIFQRMKGEKKSRARDPQGKFARDGSRPHYLRMIKLYKLAKEAGLHDGSLAVWLTHVKHWNEARTEKLEKILKLMREIENSSLPDKERILQFYRKLAARLFGLEKAQTEGAHWITIPTLAQNPQPYADRRHILLDAEGRILGGDVPRSMQGEKITDINAWRRLRSKEEPKKEEPKPDPYEAIIKELKEKGLPVLKYEEGGGTKAPTIKIGKGVSDPNYPSRGQVFVTSNYGHPGEISVKTNYDDREKIKAIGIIGWNRETKRWILPANKLLDIFNKFTHGEISWSAVDEYAKEQSRREEQAKREKEFGQKFSLEGNKAAEIAKKAGLAVTVIPPEEGKEPWLKIGNGEGLKVSLRTSGQFDGKLVVEGNTYNLRQQLEPFTTLRKENGNWVRYVDPAQFDKLAAVLQNFILSPGAQKAIQAGAGGGVVSNQEAKTGEKPEARQSASTDLYYRENTDFTLPKLARKEAFKTGDLYDYQKKGANFLIHNKRAILGFSVGLGKTNISVMAALKLMENGEVDRAAVIVPASRKYGWQDEIEKFSKAKAVVLDPNDFKDTSKARRKIEEAQQAQFVITNYEVLRDPDKAALIHDLAPDLVIADEGHKLKNYKSQQTKGFESTWKDAKYKWLLTATPMPNAQPMETYTMIKHVAPDLAGSWKSFANRYVVMQKVHTPRGDINKPIALKNVPELHEKMKSAVYIKGPKSSDVLIQLPKKRDVMPELDMTPAQAKLYRAIENDIIADLRNMTDDKWREAAPNVLAKIKRLEQVAIDPEMVTGKDEGLSPKEEWVVDYIQQHLEDPENRGVVVFCDYKMPLEKIRDALIKEGMNPDAIATITGDEKAEKRQQAERDFNSGAAKVILATSAAEEGFNLQHGAHTLVHLDQPWVPKSLVQREGRIARQGQPSEFTTMYSPVMRNSVENRKMAILAKKATDIEKLLGEESESGKRSLKAMSALSFKDIKKMFATGKGSED